MGKSSTGRQKDEKLKWWQLSLLGIAGTIGTGYFLGSGLAISIGGPAVLIAYFFAAVGTYVVFDALSRMTADHPEQGSFRSYAQKAFGNWAGFGSGWVYWFSELLINGSQLTALSIFSRFWFPEIRMWIFAAGFGILGLVIVFFGNKGFDRVENVLAIIKMAAIVMFLVLAVALLAGWIGGGKYNPKLPIHYKDFFPTGGIGLWSSFIFAFYAYGGIEVLGIMSNRLQQPKDAPKAGKVMLIMLIIITVAALTWIVPSGQFERQGGAFGIISQTGAIDRALIVLAGRLKQSHFTDGRSATGRIGDCPDQLWTVAKGNLQAIPGPVAGCCYFCGYFSCGGYLINQVRRGCLLETRVSFLCPGRIV